MRVVVFTSEEPMYLPRYVQLLLERHADAVERIVVAPFPASPLEQARSQFEMFGFRAGSRMALRYARGTLLDTLDRWAHLDLSTRPHSVRAVAAAHDVPIQHVEDVCDSAFVGAIEEIDPDVVLSIIAGQRLPKSILDCADDAINLHGSLLPAYRGRATAFWPLYYDDDKTGVTDHRMTTNFDDGPILDQRAFPVTTNDTVDSLYRKLAETGGRLAADLIDEYPDIPRGEPQNDENSSYFGVPDRTHRRKFLADGKAFL